MKTDTPCPDCDRMLDVVKLGGEPLRLVCGRFDCNQDSRTISESEARSLVA